MDTNDKIGMLIDFIFYLKDHGVHLEYRDLEPKVSAEDAIYHIEQFIRSHDA